MAVQEEHERDEEAGNEDGERVILLDLLEEQVPQLFRKMTKMVGSQLTDSVP